MDWLMHLIDWSEVWILILPLAFLWHHRRQPYYMQPIIWYLWIALICNLICDGMWLVLKWLPPYFKTNTIVYNIHSLSRFICFMIFFYRQPFQYFRKIQHIILSIFIFIFFFYFIFIDSFFNPNYISSDMMSGESFFILCFCVLYYLSVLKSTLTEFLSLKHFWIVTGIAMFEVINFFVFLFYKPLLTENKELALQIWSVHNLGFIIFILLISKAIHVPDSNKY